MEFVKHRQACVEWVTGVLDGHTVHELCEQYFNTGYYGGYLSIYEFIKDHRKDLYDQYIAWLAKQKLTGELK